MVRLRQRRRAARGQPLVLTRSSVLAPAWGFQDALGDLGHVGMTFGGGCFFGHGVNISGGTARFSLISYTVS